MPCKNLLSFDAKVRLIHSLKEIRITDCALNFCRILIEAEEAGGESHVDLHHSLLVNKLKNFTKDEKNNIVKKILKVLWVSETGAGKKLSSLLTDINHSMFKNMCSKEYFAQITAAVKSLIETFCDDKIFLRRCTATPIRERNLNMLKYFLINDGKDEAELVLLTMFKFCLPGIVFSGDEKKEVGTLMAENIMYIRESITKIILFHRSESGLDTLKARSSLQFISENFFNTKLSDHTDIIDDCIKVLDRFISSWFELEKNYDDDDSDTDCDDCLDCEFEKSNENDFIIAGGSKVPDHHTWWKEYRRIYFDRKKYIVF